MAAGGWRWNGRGGSLTWIQPLHAVGECVVRSYAQAVGVWYCAVRVEVVAAPSWVCDDGVGGDERGEEEEDGGGEGE